MRPPAPARARPRAAGTGAARRGAARSATSTTWLVGGTPVEVELARSSRCGRGPSDSSAAIRSTSSSVSSRRARRATCRTCSRSIMRRPILGGWTRRHRARRAAARTRSRPRRCARRRSTHQAPAGDAARRTASPIQRRRRVDDLAEDPGRARAARATDEQRRRARGDRRASGRPTERDRGAVRSSDDQRRARPAPTQHEQRRPSSHAQPADQPLAARRTSRGTALTSSADRADPGQQLTAAQGRHGCSPRAPARRPACSSAARSVLRSRQAIVIGPTPPGTGVIAPATSRHRVEVDVAARGRRRCGSCPRRSRSRRA